METKEYYRVEYKTQQPGWFEDCRSESREAAGNQLKSLSKNGIECRLVKVTVETRKTERVIEQYLKTLDIDEVLKRIASELRAKGYGGTEPLSIVNQYITN